MSKDIYITDITVHLHQNSSGDYREKMEQKLRGHNGVISVHFDKDEHPHSVLLAYNPDAVTSAEILAEIRSCDPAAMMAGL